MEKEIYVTSKINEYILITYKKEQISDDWVIISTKDLYYINLESILDKSIDELDVYYIL